MHNRFFLYIVGLLILFAGIAPALTQAADNSTFPHAGTAAQPVGSTDSPTFSSLSLTNALTVANGGSGNNYGGGLFYTGSVGTITGNVTLTANSPNFQVATTLSGTTTATLPLAATCPGKPFYLINDSSQQLILGRQGSDTIVRPGGTGQTVLTTNSSQGATVTVVSMGALNYWRCITPTFHCSSTSAGGTAAIWNSNGTLAGIAGTLAGQVLTCQTGVGNGNPQFLSNISMPGSITAATGFYFPPQTAPSSPATANAWVVYCDTADNKLKAKNSAGTVRELAAP